MVNAVGSVVFLVVIVSLTKYSVSMKVLGVFNNFVISFLLLRLLMYVVLSN